MKKALKKTKRRASRIAKNNKSAIFIFLVALVLIFSIFLLFNGEKYSKNEAKYEITEVDIFSLKDLKSSDVSVMGLRLGERVQEVLEKLGTPDFKTEYKDNVVNYEYSKAINLDETGIIVQMKNGYVTQITIKKPFEEFLKGKTKVDYGKKDIYMMFGAPDNTEFIPLKLGSSTIVRILEYDDIGIDFTIRKNKCLGFSLVLEFQEYNI